VNAWSEISAMIAAALGFAGVRFLTDLRFPYSLLVVVACTTVAWLIVTACTAPDSEARLVAFYRRVRPDGPGWREIAARAGGPPPAPLAGLLVDWIAGCVLVYAILFGLGALVFGEVRAALVCMVLAAGAIVVIHRDLSRRGWQTLVE
jgi:hypothetical protein